MKVISVDYMLNDEEYARLERITEEYKKHGLDVAPERQFGYIMHAGSLYEIRDKLSYHERILGIKKEPEL